MSNETVKISGICSLDQQTGPVRTFRHIPTPVSAINQTTDNQKTTTVLAISWPVVVFYHPTNLGKLSSNDYPRPQTNKGGVNHTGPGMINKKVGGSLTKYLEYWRKLK